MKYKKKPVVIEAIQLLPTRESILIIEQFIEGNYNVVESTTKSQEKFDEYVEILKEKGGRIIKTLEGEHIASFGDYVIKGIKGEFYPCKPDIFLATYELINE